MRVVAISDTHGGHRKFDLPDGDVLLHAGDFTAGGRLSDVEEFDDWLGQFPHDEKIVISGNCDRCCERSPDDVRERLDSAVYLEDESYEVGGRVVWGSPWQPTFLNMSFNLPRGEPLAEKWAEVPDETDILVTHGPPGGILDETSGGQRVGCDELLARVTELRPELHVFGHIHESSGVEEREETTFVNAACDRPHKEPVVVDL